MSERELPSGWDTATVGELCELINGCAFKPSDWSTEGKPIIRIQNLNNPDASFNYYNGQLPEKYHVNTGDLLFAWSGTPGTSFGAHIWNGVPSWLNQHIFRVVFDENHLHKAFFKLALNQRLDDIIDRAHGGVGLRHITKGKFEETSLSLPPLNEQHRIADRIDALRARSRRAREALIEAQTLLEQFRQSVLTATFTGKLTAKWREEHPDAEPASALLKRIRTERRNRWEKAELVKYAAKGKTPPPGWQKKYPEPVQVDTADLPELPQGWCWASLDEIASNVQYGTSEKTADNGDIPVLRMGNIVNGQLFFDNLKYLPVSMIPDELCLDDGDILFNRTNSIELVGKSAVFRGTDKTTFASYLIRVSVISVPPELVSEYINSPFGRSWVLSVANQQVGQANVNGTKLKALAIALPPEEEQKYIAHIFSKTRLYSDRIAQTADMSLAQCASLDQSILAKAFRGELVPQDPNDEPAAKLLERISSEAMTGRDAKKRHSRGKS